MVTRTLVSVLALFSSWFVWTATGADSTSAEPSKPAASAAADKTYRLQYKFTVGETVRSKVTHLVTVETKSHDVSETAKTRSVSTKAWKIQEVDAQGQITFSYLIESASMWQQMTGRQEVRYDSSKNEEPPAEYKHVADSLGTPLATVKISRDGRIVDRKDAKPQFNPGIGELTIPLPDGPVKIGQQWSTEGELPVRMPDKQVKRIKTRQVFTLQQVQTGLATIVVQTQILTPVNDPKVQSQLVQRIKRGEIKFDLDAGRIQSQQMDIDETVIGFNGADSIMKYLSRLSEELVPATSVASGERKPVN